MPLQQQLQYSFVMVHFPINQNSGRCCYDVSADIYKLCICKLQESHKTNDLSTANM
jgi:hypothetical protein